MYKFVSLWIQRVFLLGVESRVRNGAMPATLFAWITLEKSKAKKSLHLCRLLFISLSGSTTWTRTRDPMINSHLLYQLSYRGIRRMLLIKKDKSSISWHSLRLNRMTG